MEINLKSAKIFYLRTALFISFSIDTSWLDLYIMYFTHHEVIYFVGMFVQFFVICSFFLSYICFLQTNKFISKIVLFCRNYNPVLPLNLSNHK